MCRLWIIGHRFAVCLCVVCAWCVGGERAGLALGHVTENPYVVCQVSAKRGDNIDDAVEFLIQHRQEHHM